MTMKIFRKLLTAFSLLAMATSALAVPIFGEISINNGVDSIDFAANTVEITNNNGIVISTLGDFSGIATGTTASFSDFNYNTPITGGPIALWSVGGFSFSLETITNVSETPSVIVGQVLGLGGSGTISGPVGFDPTPFNWSFSADTSGGSLISFSSTNANVPAPGIALLMAIGLAGIATATRVRQLA